MNKDLDGLMNDSLANLYNVFQQSSGLFSPIIGGALYDSIGYHSTMDICSLVLVAFAMIYLIFNSGLTVFKDFREEKQKLEELKSLREEIEEIKKSN